MRSKRQTHVLRTAAADRTTSTNSAAGDSKDKKLESDTALLQAEEDHSGGGAVQEAYKSGIAKSMEHDNRNPTEEGHSQDTTRASNRGKSIRQCAPGNKRE